MEFLQGNDASQAVNLGSGCGVSVLDILREVQRVSGTDINIVYEARRAGDPPMLIADPAKARQLL